jgi:hypothetical protein
MAIVLIAVVINHSKRDLPEFREELFEIPLSFD